MGKILLYHGTNEYYLKWRLQEFGAYRHVPGNFPLSLDWHEQNAWAYARDRASFHKPIVLAIDFDRVWERLRDFSKVTGVNTLAPHPCIEFLVQKEFRVIGGSA